MKAVCSSLFLPTYFWAGWPMSARIDNVASVSKISNFYRFWENHQVGDEINGSASGESAAWFQVICSVRRELNRAASWRTALNQPAVMLLSGKLIGSTAGLDNGAVRAPGRGQRKPGVCSADLKLCRMRMWEKWFVPDLEVPQAEWFLKLSSVKP